ncbi:hypothetical protein ACPA2M_26850 [Ectopseudomonas chengduensis]
MIPDENIPFELKRLRYLLGTEGRKVMLVETDDGSFNLLITTPKNAFLLYAQRDRPRAFKDLGRAAELLKRYGVTLFRVRMKKIKQEPVEASRGLPELTKDSDIPF